MDVHSDSAKQDTLYFLFWCFFCLFILGCLLAIEARVLAAPAVFQVQMIPDDAFYYLGLARNFVELQQWTFDGGHSVTNGFHMLHAYILALLYFLFRPSTTGFINLGLLATGLVWVASFLTAFIFGVRRRSIPVLMALAITASQAYFFLNIANLMEWSYTILFAGLYVLLFYLSLEKLAPGRRDLALIGLVGFLGSLARSDFGALPLACALGAGLVYRLRPQAHAAGAGLFGATLGLGLVFLHNYLISGSLIQSSARIKFYWQAAADQSGPFVLRIGSLFAIPLPFASGPLVKNLVFGVEALVLGAASYFLFRRISRYWTIRIPPKDLATGIAVVVCLVINAWLLSNNAVVQPWYSTYFIIPLYILFTYGLALILRSRLFQAGRLVSKILAGLAILFLASGVYPGHELFPIWPYQQLMYQGGIYLAARPPDGRVGAWNAGIVGYFQGGRVINLDGLVNDGIYDYITSDRLNDYLSIHEIRYIIDFSTMVDHEGEELRGVYNGPVPVERLSLRKTIGNYPSGFYRQYNLYEVVPEK